MEIFTQKWTLVSLIEDKDIGFEFSADNWPLHVTIASTFEIDWNRATTRELLEQLCAKTLIFNVEVLEDTYLGPPEKPVLVSIVQKNSGLQDFHDAVVGILVKAGVVFKRPEHNIDKYIAHSTVQKHARLNKGDKLEINNLTLVDMFPEGDATKRKIVSIFRLGTI